MMATFRPSCVEERASMLVNAHQDSSLAPDINCAIHVQAPRAVRVDSRRDPS